MSPRDNLGLLEAGRGSRYRVTAGLLAIVWVSGALCGVLAGLVLAAAVIL